MAIAPRCDPPPPSPISGGAMGERGGEERWNKVPGAFVAAGLECGVAVLSKTSDRLKALVFTSETSRHRVKAARSCSTVAAPHL